MLDENDDGWASFAFVWPDCVERKNNNGRNGSRGRNGGRGKGASLTSGAIGQEPCNKIARGRFSATTRRTTTSYRYVRSELSWMPMVWMKSQMT